MITQRTHTHTSNHLLSVSLQHPEWMQLARWSCAWTFYPSLMESTRSVWKVRKKAEQTAPLSQFSEVFHLLFLSSSTFLLELNLLFILQWWLLMTWNGRRRASGPLWKSTSLALTSATRRGNLPPSPRTTPGPPSLMRASSSEYQPVLLDLTVWIFSLFQPLCWAELTLFPSLCSECRRTGRTACNTAY